MKTILKYNNLLKIKVLVENLKKDLPSRFVTKDFRNTFEVGRRKRTLQRTALKVKPVKNVIELKSVWDQRFLYIFVLGIFWPFVFTKKRKNGNQEIKDEVIALLNKYHNQ